jgi:hypothetical protein
MAIDTFDLDLIKYLFTIKLIPIPVSLIDRLLKSVNKNDNSNIIEIFQYLISNDIPIGSDTYEFNKTTSEFYTLLSSHGCKWKLSICDDVEDLQQAVQHKLTNISSHLYDMVEYDDHYQTIKYLCEHNICKISPKYQTLFDKHNITFTSNIN